MISDRRQAETMTRTIQGQLSDKPLGELIREIGEVRASGALRVSRERAKAVVYFENGAVVFAASNIRAHRLAEFLKRIGIADENTVKNLAPKATDEEVLNHIVRTHRIRPDSIGGIRANHVSDILRGLLLWTDGSWQFDPRVRIAGDTRVTVDASRLLLEATRHLPPAYITSLFRDAGERIEPAELNDQPPVLLPVEGFVLSRVEGEIAVKDLLVTSGLNEGETLQALYGLAICGAIKRSSWATSQFNGSAATGPVKVAAEAAQTETVESFLARVEKTSDHYQILGVSQRATADQIKNAYHTLARQFHPDRFHQAEPELQKQIEAAFARVARAHDVLSEQLTRADYDTRPSTSEVPPPLKQAPQPTEKKDDVDRAESSFKKGVAALKHNQVQQAIRFLAEAASLDPRCARYRAEYGRALTNDPRTRRIAEIELKAAIELEPKNVSHRVALAELYKAIGLRRRAEGELKRALTADPKNAAARNLLSSLKG